MVFFSEQPLSAVTPPNNLEALKSLIAHDTEDAGPALSPSPGVDDGKPSGRTTPAGPSSDDPDVLRPLEHDLVIWLGDLNYRIDLTREEILAAAKATEWETLHASDQLLYGVTLSPRARGWLWHTGRPVVPPAMSTLCERFPAHTRCPSSRPVSCTPE